MGRVGLTIFSYFGKNCEAWWCIFWFHYLNNNIMIFFMEKKSPKSEIPHKPSKINLIAISVIIQFIAVLLPLRSYKYSSLLECISPYICYFYIYFSFSLYGIVLLAMDLAMNAYGILWLLEGMSHTLRQFTVKILCVCVGVF